MSHLNFLSEFVDQRVLQFQSNHLQSDGFFKVSSGDSLTCWDERSFPDWSRVILLSRLSVNLQQRKPLSHDHSAALHWSASVRADGWLICSLWTEPG